MWDELSQYLDSQCYLTTSRWMMDDIIAIHIYVTVLKIGVDSYENVS